ncbi:MAG: hypothetical protein AAF748_09420 [Pseudomonadota bacterium]
MKDRARAASTTPEDYLASLLAFDDALRGFRAKFSEETLGEIGAPVDAAYWSDLQQRATGKR